MGCGQKLGRVAKEVGEVLDSFVGQGYQPGLFFFTLHHTFLYITSYLYISGKDPLEWGTLMTGNREDSPEICPF